MPELVRVKDAFNQRAVQSSDLHDMVGLPRSQGQFDATVVDIARKLNLSAVDSLIEIGCGNANLLSSLKPYVRRTVGVDFAFSQLRTARTLLSDGSFVCVQANAIPFPDFSFDRVLCYSVFHHFPDVKYARRVILELCRLCKPNGLVLVGDLPDKKVYRKVVSRRWEVVYRLRVLRGRHPGPSIFNPLNWIFFDLAGLARYVESIGHTANILNQPPGLIAADYRRDILIRVRKG